MVDAFLWFLAVEFLGLLAFPLAFLLFRRLPDRGYTLTKALALALFSYLLWIGGLTQLVPNSFFTIIGILALGALGGGLALRCWGGQLAGFLRAEWRTLLVAEGVFIAFFVLWVAIVSHAPAINHTEKPMDFGFMNAILQSRYFPPEDPWLSGHSIAYYYFGYFMMAFLTKLTSVPSSVGYNLAVSLVPALVAVGAFGLLYNLVRLSGGSRSAALGFGLVAPVLVAVVGNLQGALEFVHAQGWGSAGFWDWVGIKGLAGGAAASGGAFPGDYWWWWRASRVIDTLDGGQSLDYTITEFPFFSFILGDLHPHMMSLPFLVLALSLGLNTFLSTQRLGLGWLRQHPLEAAAVAFSLGLLAFVNTWDFPLMVAVLGGLFLARSYGYEAGNLLQALKNTALMLGPVVLLAVALFLPFYLGLSSQASGIARLSDVSTRPFLFFMVMGLFLFLGASFLLRQLPGVLRPTRRDAPAIILTMAVVLTPFLLWAVIELVGVALQPHVPGLLWVPVDLLLGPFEDGLVAAIAKIGGRFLWLLPGMAIVGLAAFSAAQRLRLGIAPVAAFPLVLLAVAFYLLVGVELFYLLDFFGNRMNTVFKVYYQSWLLLALVGAYGLYYWHSRWPGPLKKSPQTSILVATGTAEDENPLSPVGERVRVRGLHPYPNPSPQGERGLHSRQPTLAKEGNSGAWLLAGGYYVWAGVAAALLVVSLYYPVGAALERTGFLGQGQPPRERTLDGLAFIRHSDPGEYAAIGWLRDQAPWGRIVEAVGDDYSEYGRISSSTGLPTVLGWKGHELQWRGSSRLFEGREEDVARIYQSDDGEVVRGLLERYDVRYVYYGRRERASYGGSHLAEFDGLLKIAFEQDGVVIYEMRESVEQVAGHDTN